MSDVEGRRHPARCVGQLDKLVGSSPAIRAVRRSLRRLARLHTPLVITGEIGTGKRLLARTLARASDSCYFEADIAAVPEEFLGLEVFGFERGTVSWAKKSRPGLLELARGGTVCLRNFDVWPQHLELALLRGLREGVVVRMGGGQPVPVRARIIGLTSADPTTFVKSGVPSRDLFRTLAVNQVHLPPLRERGGDITLLARHFVTRFAAAFRKPDVGITDEALARLHAHCWPGNVRELANTIERALILRHWPPTRRRRPAPPDIRPIGVADLPRQIADPSARLEA